MKFHDHAKRIEDLEFQIQFVALSGTSVLLFSLSNHENVRDLLNDAANGEVVAEDVYLRILDLLPKVATEKEMSYDGSIVTYLYCLSAIDLSLAQRASLEVMRFSGVFWSRRLARYVNELHLNRQIGDSLRAHSVTVHETRYNLPVQRIKGEVRTSAPPTRYPVLTDKHYAEWQVELSQAELVVA